MNNKIRATNLKRPKKPISTSSTEIAVRKIVANLKNKVKKEKQILEKKIPKEKKEEVKQKLQSLYEEKKTETKSIIKRAIEVIKSFFKKVINLILLRKKIKEENKKKQKEIYTKLKEGIKENVNSLRNLLNLKGFNEHVKKFSETLGLSDDPRIKYLIKFLISVNEKLNQAIEKNIDNPYAFITVSITTIFYYNLFFIISISLPFLVAVTEIFESMKKVFTEYISDRKKNQENEVYKNFPVFVKMLTWIKDVMKHFGLGSIKQILIYFFKIIKTLVLVFEIYLLTAINLVVLFFTLVIFTYNYIVYVFKLLFST